MSYEIGPGIPESSLPKWLEEAAGKYGTFDDGRVNYKQAEIAPVVMCAIAYEDKILLVKRGYGLADAEGYWSIVSGFIDEAKPVIEQVRQEVREELGIKVTSDQVGVGESYTLKNPTEKREYIVFPCLISLTEKPKIMLDSEHTEYAWVRRGEVESYYILDDLPYVIDAAFAAHKES